MIRAIDLIGDFVVLPQFSSQETMGNVYLFSYARGRKLVQICALVSAAAKVVNLDPTLVDQCLEAIIGLAQANPDSLRKLSLGKFGIALKQR